MTTETLRVDTDVAYGSAIGKAAAVLNAGGLVVFPTETVYGLAANAALPEAIGRLREVKKRPPDKPFTVHIGRADDLGRYVSSPSPQGRRLAKKGWPGPLTLIFTQADPDNAPVMKELPSGQGESIYKNGTIGLRCPDTKPALDLLTEVKAPVVAASANPAGEPPAISGEEAGGYLAGKVDLILDAGRARYAKPSTIVRVNEHGCEIVRAGVFDDRMITRMLTTNILFVCSGNTCRSPMAAGICRKLLAERVGCAPEALGDRGFVISSAGTYGMSGNPATPEAVNACAGLGVDIADHRAQALTPELVHAADYIFGMTQAHTEAAERMLPSARGRILRLDPDSDLQDPIGGEQALYRSLAERIEGLTRRHLEDIDI